MQPPYEPDPNALTQPMSRVQPPPVEAAPPPHAGPPAPPPRYDHRFGNLPSYLLGRLLAFAVDVVGVAFLLATFGFNAFNLGYVAFATRDERGFDTLVLFSIGGALALVFVCEAIFGATLGKLIFGLHVRSVHGGHAGLGRAFVRNLIRPIDVLVIGPVLALITPRHQRLGDLFAGTVVGRSPIGAFATIVGLVFLALIAFAQASYGGGLTSAVGVSAETALFLPQLYARLTNPLYVPVTAPNNARAASPSPEPTPSDPPQSVAPPASPETAAPSDPPSRNAPTGAPSAAEPAPPVITANPRSAPSSQPTSDAEPTPEEPTPEAPASESSPANV